mmetsp:Transcript_59431/g.173931  ORF Transcript_59431/g.173931 Transcript_59431/m.173931 type:complete len:229 (-) Transcript_59431:1513-2199(-)
MGTVGSTSGTGCGAAADAPRCCCARASRRCWSLRCARSCTLVGLAGELGGCGGCACARCCCCMPTRRRINSSGTSTLPCGADGPAPPVRPKGSQSKSSGWPAAAPPCARTSPSGLGRAPSGCGLWASAASGLAFGARACFTFTAGGVVSASANGVLSTESWGSSRAFERLLPLLLAGGLRVLPLRKPLETNCERSEYRSQIQPTAATRRSCWTTMVSQIQACTTSMTQ